MIAVALALAGPRQDGEAAEERMDFAAAIGAYQACETDRDRVFCDARRAELEPQAADGFAGWRVLAEVRRDYRTLESDAAIARIEAALAEGGPAAADLRMWLANERVRRGEFAEVEALATALGGTSRAWAESRVSLDRMERRRRVAAGFGALAAATYAGRAVMGTGGLRWRSAALAGMLLGAVPVGFAAMWEAGLWDGFARSGLVVTIGVLLAGRVGVGLAVTGTVGGLVATAWANGWMASLGF